MYAKNWALGAALLAGCMASWPATADIVQLSGITARWFDGNPAANVDYYANNTTAPYARWGTPGSPGGNQSGYDFTVASQPISFTVNPTDPPTPSEDRVVGTFKHQNFPIYADTSITDIKLEITADVYVNSSQVGNDLKFTYAFDHWETPNDPDPRQWHETCANGTQNLQGVNENGCADRVIAEWEATSQKFLIGAKEYTLNVKGFSLDTGGNSPFTSFWTKENATNVAYLVANVALYEDLVPPGELPEPPTLALLGLGLAGVGYASRRSRHRNSR